MVSASTVLMLRLWHKVLFVDQDWISNQVVCHKRQKGQLGKYWSSNGKWLDPFFPPSFILYTQTSLIWSMPRRAHGLVHFCCSHLIWSDTDISYYIQITRKPFLCLSCWPECPPHLLYIALQVRWDSLQCCFHFGTLRAKGIMGKLQCKIILSFENTREPYICRYSTLNREVRGIHHTHWWWWGYWLLPP